MAKMKSTYQGKEKGTVRVRGTELRISPKESYEVANALRNLKISKAKKLLTEAIELKKPVPYRRYNRGGTGHRKKIGPGRFPIKTSKTFLKLLNELEANATFKGLNAEDLILKHIATHRGSPIRNYYKGGPHFTQVTHVEIIASLSEGKK